MPRYNISSIPLQEIIKHYFAYSDQDFEKQGSNIYVTRCPLHKEKRGTSLSLYDKPTGWDWFCFGACQRGGTAAKLLVEAKLFPTLEEATEDLRKVFKLSYPSTVTLETFAEMKGFSLDFLKQRGCAYHETGSLKGVVIPFYDKDRNTIAQKLRLKFDGSGKYTFIQGKNAIYGLDLLASFSEDYLFICEGETDALTLLQAGLQAIGIPGASAWQTHWAEALHKFQKIVVLADNDKAGQGFLLRLAQDFPSSLYAIPLPRTVKDVNNLFLYHFAGDLDAFRKHITPEASLPATPASFKAHLIDSPVLLSNLFCWQSVFLCLKDDVEQMLFVEELKETLSINKNIITKAYRAAKGKAAPPKTSTEASDLFIRNNCYFKKVFTEAGYAEAQISNFVMHLSHTIEADGDYVRICRLVNEKSQTSRPVFFDGDTLTKPLEFMSACKRAGNYIFKGEFKDLIALNELLLSQEETVVHAPSHIGRVEGNRWLMGKYGVDSSGNISQANDDAIIMLDDQAFMVRNLNVVDDNDETYLPVLPRPYDITADYLRDVAFTLKDNLGGYEAWLALGFTVAGWHSDEIYLSKQDKFYPIFFISGKRNSGKTYLARWLMGAYGFPHIEGRSFSLPSVVSMTRKLGYYSSLPQWYGDYLNNINDIRYRNEFMLGVYNRQGADKGTRSGFGVRSEPIRGFLLLDGEDTPSNNAVLSRCTVIQVSSYQRDDTKLQHMLSLAEHFPAMGLYFLQEKQKHGSSALIASINNIQAFLEQEAIDARLAKNTAIFAAGFLHAFGPVLTEEDRESFLAWLCSRTVDMKLTTDSEHTVAKFFTDLTVLMANNKIEQGHHYAVSGGRIYLWFRACYDVWAQEYGEDIKRTVLVSYIEKEPFYKQRNHVYRISEHVGTVRTVVLDYSLIPDEDFRTFCQARDEEQGEF